MKVLFISSAVEDYLSDALCHGLRSLLGPDLVDFPKCELLYVNCPAEVKSQARGKGFTLYTGLLDDIPIDRFNIVSKVQRGHYDLVVLSDIWRQFGLFVQLRAWLDPRKTVVIDGADTPQVYPYAGLWWRRPYYWFLPRAHRDFPYFKREWTNQTRFDLWSRAIPPSLRGRLPASAQLRPISFSIPEEKIVAVLPAKQKEFATHVVDAEVAARVPGSHTGYAFTDEAAYYGDLQASRFGVTTKRAGWDCLRHYEIAANGCVPCFRDLDGKAVTCAPHGLNRENCLIYSNADDLLQQVASISSDDYVRLQRNAWQWAKHNSTRALAERVLAAARG